jgi:hypothetical protein
MPKRVTRRSVGYWSKLLRKREPNCENQTEQSKRRGHDRPAHMGGGELSRDDPDGDTRPPFSEECEVSVARTPMRQKRHDGRWQDCR